MSLRAGRNAGRGEAAVGEVDVVLSDVSTRVVGFAIDAIVLSGLVFLGAALVWVIVGPTVTFGEPEDVLRGRVTVDQTLAAINGLVSLAISAAYFIGSWLLLRGSPGMRLLGLRVGSETDGARLRVRSAVIRWLLLAFPFAIAALLALVIPPFRLSLSAVVAAWYLILLATAAASGTNQAIHDHYAGSVVTRAARRPPWSRSS